MSEVQHTPVRPASAFYRKVSGYLGLSEREVRREVRGYGSPSDGFPEVIRQQAEEWERVLTNSSMWREFKGRERKEIVSTLEREVPLWLLPNRVTSMGRVLRNIKEHLKETGYAKLRFLNHSVLLHAMAGRCKDVGSDAAIVMLIEDAWEEVGDEVERKFSNVRDRSGEILKELGNDEAAEVYQLFLRLFEGFIRALSEARRLARKIMELPLEIEVNDVVIERADYDPVWVGRMEEKESSEGEEEDVEAAGVDDLISALGGPDVPVERPSSSPPLEGWDVEIVEEGEEEPTSLKEFVRKVVEELWRRYGAG